MEIAGIEIMLTWLMQANFAAALVVLCIFQLFASKTGSFACVQFSKREIMLSRYNVEVDGWPENLTLLVGWDEGLATYFARLYDGNRYADDSECLLWIATAELIPAPELLSPHLNASFSEGTHPAIIFWNPI